MSKKGGAAKAKEEATYEFRDIVLAKLRGFPAWPAQVREQALVIRERVLTFTSLFTFLL